MISEFDFDIVYVKGKENNVVDALSIRVHAAYVVAVSIGQSDLKDKILKALDSDAFFLQTKENLQQADVPKKYKDYQLEEDRLLRFKNRVYIPDSSELRKLVLQEMHDVPYAGHPGYQKTVIAVIKEYFWLSMKNDVASYISRCMKCQKVKVEHRHPTGLLQPLQILEWKWEVVTIDFITKLPRSSKQHDSIMVVVDKLTKAAHFVTVQ